MATKSKKFPHQNLANVARVCLTEKVDKVETVDGQLWAVSGDRRIPIGIAPEGGPTETDEPEATA